MRQAIPPPSSRAQDGPLPPLLVGQGAAAARCASEGGMNWRRIFARRAAPNPARELALIGHHQHREAVKARARLMREQLCLPPLPILNPEGK